MMIRIVLAVIFISWAFLFAYYSRRYFQRHQPGSVVVAFACLGWPLFIAREFHLLARATSVPFVAAALTGGVLGTLIVLVAEAQRVHPFR